MRLSRYPKRAPLFYFSPPDRIWGAEILILDLYTAHCHADAVSMGGSSSPAQSTSIAWMAVDPARAWQPCNGPVFDSPPGAQDLSGRLLNLPMIAEKPSHALHCAAQGC